MQYFNYFMHNLRKINQEIIPKQGQNCKYLDVDCEILKTFNELRLNNFNCSRHDDFPSILQSRQTSTLERSVDICKYRVKERGKGNKSRGERDSRDLFRFHRGRQEGPSGPKRLAMCMDSVEGWAMACSVYISLFLNLGCAWMEFKVRFIENYH